MPRPANFESRALFIDWVLPLRFIVNNKGNVVGPTNGVPGCYAPRFEELSPENQAGVVQMEGLDPERIGLESMGRIVGGVRAGLEWLEQNPGQNMLALEIEMRAASDSI